MKGLFTSIFILLIFSAHAQHPHVDTMDFNPELKDATYSFPVIRTGDPHVDSIILVDMLRRLTQMEFVDPDPDSILNEWIGESITFVDFEVTYLDSDLVSFNISAEGCGAYCSGWTDYFTYSTISGKFIALDEVVDMSSGLMKRVRKERARQYRRQREDLSRINNDGKPVADEETRAWVLESYQSCENSPLKNFALYPGYIRIVDDCDMPHAIRAFTPVIQLKYNYKEIGKHFKLRLAAKRTRRVNQN